MSGERGAAAVEFALVVSLLMVLLLGIFEFGRMFNEQIAVSNAAREAARVMAITDSVSDAQAAAVASSAPSLDPDLTPGQVGLSVATCVGNEGEPVVATVTYPAVLPFAGFLGLVLPDGGTTLELTGSGQTVCGG
ncbi:TadE/TadG family type IV pilus assembly protein [Microbacterium sp. SD291]|uniref:TadE/TadG family type IV pilus assembly protein n=1 Tax=Microbacterium sp. SD291 TaxID=2782007 RepID=UPI001F60AD5D|nr:TadE/TadG family type IV pilus assembly protein [Microbacterium sp. SD291]